MQVDGTMGVDVLLCNSLNRWPWLSDFSVLNTLASIVVPVEKMAPTDAEPSHLPWTYINVVLENTQAVLPFSSDLLKLSETMAALGQQQDSESLHRAPSPHPENQALMQLASYAYRARKVPDTVSQALVDRPAVFQLMCQV
jgi:hypothetical protein